METQNYPIKINLNNNNILKEIHQIEKNFIKSKIIKTNKKINFFKTEEFKNMYKNYKISIKMLMDDPEHFKTIREICTNSEDEHDIWNSEHFDLIQGYIKFSNKLKKLIKIGYKKNILSKLEKQVLEDIYVKINNVWKIDRIFSDVYKDYIFEVPSNQEIDYFFALTDIIQFKLEISIKDINLLDILDDSKYLGCIFEYRNRLERELVLDTNYDDTNQDEW